MKIEFSEDETTWYQETSYILSEEVYAIHKPALREIQDSANAIIPIPVSATFFRISAAAMVSSSGTSLAITATIANI